MRAFIVLAAAAYAAAQTYPVTQGKTYKFEKIADGIYYATGGSGSNNVVVVNDSDVLLVDTGTTPAAASAFIEDVRALTNKPIRYVVNDSDVLLVDTGTTPAAARAFIEDVRALTNKPIRYVVNTHFHYDHTDGNSVFGPEVDIIAHEFVRNAILNFDVLHREPFVTSQARMPADVRETIKPTPPNVTYSSKMVLNKGPHEIQLLFLGRGHTAGDTVVFLPRERIVATGDLMETQLAYMGDAYFDEWVVTLEALKKLDFATVLPGHGTPFGDKGHITAFQAYLTDLVKQATALKKQGVSVEDAAKRVDLTAHATAFPQIKGPGADLRGMRRLYTWIDEK